MQIYKPNGTLFLETEVSDSSYRVRALMSQHNFTVIIDSEVQIMFSVGCYFDFQGIRYTIRKKSAIKKSGIRNLNYTVIFEAPQADAEKRTVRNMVDKRLKFDYTATPKDHAELIVWNLNQISSGWAVGECIVAPPALVAYNLTKCLEGVKAIADKFNTEWEIGNKTLHLRKVEYNKDNPLPLAYGRGNGFKTGITRDNVDSIVPIEILAVQGGTRNIDYSKYGNNELLLPKGQTISFDGSFFEDEEGFNPAYARSYIVDDEGLTIQRADKELATYEDGSTDLSNIYPMREGTVTAVEVTDSGLYSIIDTTIPEDLDYSQYRIDGEEMSVIFQDGMLASREFNVMQDKDRVTGYNHSQRKFMLVSQEYDGYTMPTGVYVPKVGDKYAVFGMMMPDEYVRDDASRSGASWEMFRQAVRVLFEEEQDKFAFTGDLDGQWAKRDWENIGGKIVLGGYVRFTDNQMLESPETESVLIRQTRIEDYYNDPHKPKITLANVTAATYASDFRKIAENEVIAESNNKSTVNFVRRSWRGTMELINNIYDPSGSFQEDLLSAVAIRTMAIALGDESLQFDFMDSNFNTEIEPSIVYNKDHIECAASYIRHNTIGIDTVQPARGKTEYLYWDIPAYNSAILDDPTKFYYLFLKVSKTYTTNPDGLKIGTGEFFISTEKLKFDSDPDNYTLLVAFVNSEEASGRAFTFLYGSAELTPGMLRINNIASMDGQSYIRLLANQFRIGNESRYLAWNVIAGLLEIMNASLEIKNSDGDVVASIDGVTGAALFGKGSTLFNNDGSGQLANGNISWDKNGNPIFNGIVTSTDANGNKIIIDATQGKISIFSPKGAEVGTWSYTYSSDGVRRSYNTSIKLRKFLEDIATGTLSGLSDVTLSPSDLIFSNLVNGQTLIINNVIPKDNIMRPVGTVWSDSGDLKIVE